MSAIDLIIGLGGVWMIVLGKAGFLMLAIWWLLNEESRTLDTLFFMVFTLYLFASGLYYRNYARERANE